MLKKFVLFHRFTEGFTSSLKDTKGRIKFVPFAARKHFMGVFELLHNAANQLTTLNWLGREHP